MDAKKGYVYILTNKRNNCLYTGVTSDLIQRIYVHKTGQIDGFASTYKTNKLVYYEVHEEIGLAIAREKQIKGWLRKKKIALIKSMNPDWEDLYPIII